MAEHYCNLHNVKLTEGLAPILYGTFAPEPAHVLAERTSTHPFANAMMRGSCWVENETHAKVMFCPACREAWQRTPEAQQLADCLAQERPSLEQEIEGLRAQQAHNKRYNLILRLVRLVVYSALGATLGAASSYFTGYGVVLGTAVGAAGGAVVGALSNRSMA